MKSKQQANNLDGDTLVVFFFFSCGYSIWLSTSVYHLPQSKPGTETVNHSAWTGCGPVEFIRADR